MATRVFISLGLAGAIRYLLMISHYSKAIKDRVEVATPLNSWKRVEEGAFLRAQGVDPYSGDLYHNSPLALWLTSALITHIPQWIPTLFILVDLLTGCFLYATAKTVTRMLLRKQEREKHLYAKDTDEFQISEGTLTKVPQFVLIAYLFNPYTIMSCIGQTMTVWSNFLLAGFLLGMSHRQLLVAIAFLAVEVQQNLYPITLIIPLIINHALVESRSGQEKAAKNKKVNDQSIFKWTRAIVAFVVIAVVLFAVAYLNFLINHRQWSFADSTFGFILGHRDLQPNIGLFWYFFTEMFDHFRVFFLYTFQLNALVLYLVPLTLKFRREPLFMATLLIALNAIFRSYPCIGDVAFYLALLPMWQHVHRFMSHNFIVACFFLVTSALGPVVWHLWINSASANANFYFGVTLSFATAQIFLVTDLLFAYVKREFYLEHGNLKQEDGKEGKIALLQ